MKKKKTKKAAKASLPSKPLALLILDGWGIGDPTEEGNAIALARTKNIDGYMRDYPMAKLRAHGHHVGLPKGQEGNSEAGHLNIGGGRVVEQDAVRVTRAITDGSFFKNPAFCEVIDHVKKKKSRLHVMGLLSNGMSAHSDPDHLIALLDLAKRNKVKEVYVHLFTDGRDSPPHSALKLIEKLQPSLKGKAKIATIMGRYYGMDRKKNWDLTEEAYDVLTCEKCTWHKADSVIQAITESYNRGNTDEFMEPCVIHEKGKRLPEIQSEDGIIFFNLRSDRARQITKAFMQRRFEKLNPDSFKRKNLLQDVCFVAMTDFGPDLDNVITAFPSANLEETLPMQFDDKRQVYIAETEKYAHVTYFFNGGYPDPVAGEKRVIVDSPDVKHYDTMPLMSTKALTRAIMERIQRKFDFIVANFAAPDMIAHTGNLQAAIKAAEGTDKAVAKVVNQALKQGMRVIITADHGNLERLVNPKTHEIDTEHSITPVPCILIDSDLFGATDVLKKTGKLADIAPTILELFGKPQPKEMTGRSLLK